MENQHSRFEQPTAIVGTTGAGKTFAAKVIVEQMLEEGRRVIIIDPTGAWWGLRAGADGDQSGGFKIMIFGGEHADFEVEPTGENGKALALALAERDVQAVLDISEMTGGEKIRFLTPFLETLYAKNKAALHLVVDEADEIAAQKPADGEQRLLGIFDKIVRRGRIKGFRPLMITQRPAVIHKNVLSQIGTLIALKLTSPQDRKAIDDWIKGNADTGQAKEVMASLPTLPRGVGWVWSPAENVLEKIEFPKIRTFDSSRTPEIGEVITAPSLAHVDVDELRSALLTKDDDVPSTSTRSKTNEAAAFERGKAEGYKLGYNDGVRLGAHRNTIRIVEAISEAGIINADHDHLIDAAKAMKTVDLKLDESMAAAGRPNSHEVAPKQSTAPAKKQVRKSQSSPLLQSAIDVWPAKLSWSVLAAMCGRKARGGHFNSTRKALIDGGEVKEEGGLVILCNPPERPERVIPADLLEANLPQPAAKMFSEIRKNPGHSIESLAEALGMQPRGGHWNNGMSILRRNDLIFETNGINVRADLLSVNRQNLGIGETR